MDTKNSRIVEKDVWISIKGSDSSSGDEGQIELITEGRMHIENGTYLIEYDESSMTGMLGTRTSLSISGDDLILARQGAVNTNFVFSSGRRQDSVYETENGGVMMSIYTNSIDIALDDKGGEIKIDYQIDFLNKTGRNYLHMFVREAKH